MANRAQEIILAALGYTKQSFDQCGNLVGKKRANYRAYTNALCPMPFGATANVTSKGIAQYGDNLPLGACCDDSCGGAAGSIPVQKALSNKPSSPVTTTYSSYHPKGTGPTAPAPTVVGG